MNKNLLFILWACLFSLCAGLGFIPEPEGRLQIVMSVLSLLCFLPPALLLYDAHKNRDLHTAKLIRTLSGLSLKSHDAMDDVRMIASAWKKLL